MDLRTVGIRPPGTSPTRFDLITENINTRLHEVKTMKLDNGNLLVGCPLVRAGMCVLELNPSTGDISNIKYQMYDNDRTNFPDTIINPCKAFYDSTIWTPSRRHKWDFRVCHSIIPYSHQSKKYLLTVDEFNNNVGYTRDTTKLDWEEVDYYLPNLVTWHTDTCGNLDYIQSVDEPFSHRLNYRHRNHPLYSGVDPNKFQGAFLRIWDDSLLFQNDTTLNGQHPILNAYDVEEDGTRNGYIMTEQGIPRVSSVIAGLHEPNLFGDTLYLATYNYGARILDLKGDTIRLLGYCDTEEPLSDSINSDRWYGSPDYKFPMYANGIYRLLPDPWRSGVVYGSDLNNGLWLYRFYYGEISDTIRHISMQPWVEIGTVDCDHPMRFNVNGSTYLLPGDSAILVNCSTFKFNCDTMFVSGKLQVNEVYFDTSSACALSNIVCKSGGNIRLGDLDVGDTINGLYNLTIDSGGEAEIRNNTVLNMKQGGAIHVSGTLIIKSATFNDVSKIICENGGQVIFNPNATISNLDSIGIKDGGILFVKERSLIRMSNGGVISIKGTMDANLPEGTIAWFDAYDTLWQGIVFDTLATGTVSSSILKHVHIHHAITGVKTYHACPTIENDTITLNTYGIFATGPYSPMILDNRIDSNNMGLYGNNLDIAIVGNKFCYNAYAGVILYDCANYWVQNIIDYNGYGILAGGNNSVLFNFWEYDWSGNLSCDTANGNSVRFNYRNAYFNALGNSGNINFFICYNSVHHHDPAWYDFWVTNGAWVVGDSSCPDINALTLWVDNGAQFDWYHPLYTDNIWRSPPKSSSISKTSPSYNPSFYDRMHVADSLSFRGLFSPAAVIYKDAFQFAQTEYEAQYCIARWRQIFMDAMHNRPSIDQLSNGSRWAQDDFTATLEYARTNSNRPWLKKASTEGLALHYGSPQKSVGEKCG